MCGPGNSPPAMPGPRRSALPKIRKSARLAPVQTWCGCYAMALHVLAYNLKRVMAILGVPKLLDAI
jgi:hypothetical protein